MPEETAKTLAAEIVNSGYQVVSESEINEIRDAILQREITTMTMKQKTLTALSIAIDNLIQRIFDNTATISLLFDAIELQWNIQDALDEINDELHLERYPI